MMNLEIEKAVNFLEQGKTILCPSDTIWGISCDATNFDAIEKIYAIKNRAKSKSLIVLVSDFSMLKKHVGSISKNLVNLLNNTEEPLTIVYPSAKNLAKNCYAQDHSVALRIVQNGFCKDLIDAFQKPIVSTSANFSNEATALNFGAINEQLKNKIDFIVAQKFESDTSKSSRILKIVNDEIQILRA